MKRWTMLQINPSGYLDFGSNLEQIRLRQWLFENPHTVPDEPADIAIDIKGTLETLRQLASDFDLPVTKEILREEIVNVPDSYREIALIIRVVKAELKSKLFLYVPFHAAKFYERDDILSDKAKAAFPSAFSELKLAGNCFALSLYTACIFHSMRAAEIGVRVLGSHLNVSFPFPIELAEWQNVLDQIESKIKEKKNLQKGQVKDEDLQFYSTSASQFRYFKDGWRIRVAHARAVYAENEAIRVLDHTRDFFESLAGRLKET